jgi:hypothetical protein
MTLAPLNFHGQGCPLTAAGMSNACEALGAGVAEVWAVLTVETLAFGFLADRRPQILFERHIFHHLTKGRFDATHPGISNKVPGGYAGNGAEYTRLNAAVRLDYEAALESTSWGVGQVLGFNYERAGFALVDDMVADMIRDEDAQLTAMYNFIRNSGLGPALQRRDWAAFARGYNGAAFQKTSYDTRLATAYAKYQTAAPDLAVRAAQAALLYLGIDPGPIDGFQGPLTRGALLAFQAREALPLTGLLDERTEATLAAAAFPP